MLPGGKTPCKGYKLQDKFFSWQLFPATASAFYICVYYGT